MNFFDYVKLIKQGWNPDPPSGSWEQTRHALLELEKVARACAGSDQEAIADANRLKEYIEYKDKEFKYERSVE